MLALLAAPSRLGTTWKGTSTMNKSKFSNAALTVAVAYMDYCQRNQQTVADIIWPETDSRLLDVICQSENLAVTLLTMEDVG